MLGTAVKVNTIRTYNTFSNILLLKKKINKKKKKKYYMIKNISSTTFVGTVGMQRTPKNSFR